MSWTGGPANRWDWVGVYPAAKSDPKVDSYLIWNYVGQHAAGAVPPSVEGSMHPGRDRHGQPWPLPAGRCVRRATSWSTGTARSAARRSRWPPRAIFDGGANPQVAWAVGSAPPAHLHVMKTYSPKPRDIERRWYVLDASGAILGRLATQAATILRRQAQADLRPHADTGDHVIVINAKEVTLSGGKENKKICLPPLRLPGRPDQKPCTPSSWRRSRRSRSRRRSGACSRTTGSGRQMATKLRVYAGADHRHEAQMPQRARARRVPEMERPARGRDARESDPEDPPGAEGACG